MRLFRITMQYMENYNCKSYDIKDSYFKFKGGSDVVVKVPDTTQNCEGTLVAKVMHLLNRGKLCTGSFYTARDWDYITQEQLDEYEEWELPIVYTVEELDKQLTNIEVAA